jgi:non-ribosomal peptide synthetase component E (peptide arylation enzyme)
MLEGVVPFPPEYAARYRARGYWADRALRDEFSTVFQRYAERVALVDGERTFTYGEVDRLSTNLALNLLDIGLVPLDRVILALPNVAEFVILYFALQKTGAIPIAALVTHRFAEISQFAHLSGATAVATPDRTRDFDFSACFGLHALHHRAQTRDRARRGDERRAVARRPHRAAGNARPAIARRDRDRSDRSVRVPALGRHDRHSKADPAHAQRLRL